MVVNVHDYSDSSIRQRISALSAFLKYASRREMSALNAYSAVLGAELPSVYRTEFPYFTLEETRILLRLPNPNVYLGKRDLVAFSFLYDTAARAEEFCKAKVGDIRFGKPTKVKLHGKGSKTREIPISDEVSDLLRFHLKDYVNTARWNGLIRKKTY
jgi:integrase